MSLKEQLAEYRAGWDQRVPGERQAIMQRHIDELRAGPVARTTLKVGDQAPPIVLKNAKGTTVDVGALIKKGPVIVSFYRGRGSTACRDQPGKTRRHTIDRRKERSQVRGAQRPRPKGRTCIRPGLLV